MKYPDKHIKEIFKVQLGDGKWVRVFNWMGKVKISSGGYFIWQEGVYEVKLRVVEGGRDEKTNI